MMIMMMVIVVMVIVVMVIVVMVIVVMVTLILPTGSVLDGHHHVFWCGDMNYRVELSREEVDQLLEKNDLRVSECDGGEWDGDECDGELSFSLSCFETSSRERY